jgi:glycosyltransferase involved in cell wall biosynthesis
MRLALFSDTFAPQLNGVARTLRTLVDEVHGRGGEVRVFTTSDPRAESSPGVERWASTPCPSYPELRLSAPNTRRALEALKAYAPTVVHAATPFGLGISGRAAAQRLGIPFVSSYHTSFGAYARFYGLSPLEEPVWSMLRSFHNSGLRTFCPTHAIRRELEVKGFTGVHVWGRGVDRRRFTPLKRSRVMRERMGGTERHMVVAYVGRIAREKGLDHLLDAARRLATADAKVVFAFAGDGPHLGQCRREAPGTCRFLGRLEGEELAAFYASADIFVFPSETDTFGNVLLEAMATGLPMVAAATAPSREIAGRAAVWYPPNDGSLLAHSISELAWSASRRRELGGLALARAANHSWDVVFDAMFAEYDRAIHEHASSGLGQQTRSGVSFGVRRRAAVAT